MVKKVLLIILDGFGEGHPYEGNAVTLAKTPTLTELRKKYPWTLLEASGKAVGVPAETQGGSEIGHFTIGAGRVVWQSLEEINLSMRDRSFFKKPDLLEACRRANSTEESVLHLIGMISDQGVHSDIRHLFALLELAKFEGVKKVFIHAITDGRDVSERSAPGFIKGIQAKIESLAMEREAKIATIIGRYYAMDRDSNWDRTQKAYDLFTSVRGIEEKDPLEAIQNFYDKGTESDYYIEPIILDKNGVIKNEDAVIFWNFRSDRARQLTWAFTGEADPIGFKQEKIVRPFFVCMGPFSEASPVVFPAPIVKNNLGEIISKNGLRQLRIAETEKYAHITYFLNSQIEAPLEGEERILIDSPKCPSYAEKPEMSAIGITDALLPKLKSQEYQFIALNFANCDLVGHSGNLQAAIKAVETVDLCLGRIVPEALKNEYCVLITGDHGNAEYMIYEGTGEPCPSHTTNPVPFIVVNGQGSGVRKGELKDIAPTILKIMGIEKPREMTGESLIKS
ncbi:2,3-bisphosphoglycerate-independent phosphoglycerate mutase [Candidatus Peregrinibacteria bacterium]|nr:2,3-bisphosphoglycerate-independent phosphoglycerate mutase [Candidatus Peregrinibacteria bacterium]